MGRAFEKRKSTIFARMDRVAKQFTKIGKDLAIAVKSGGTSPDGNPALRRALQNARAVNMPKDKVEAATDNVTRTVANVRHHFKAHGGNLGTTGSVAFMFHRQGVFRLSPHGVDRDELELALIDHGLVALEDGESDKGEPQLLVHCAFGDFGAMQAAIESRGLTPLSSQSEYVAHNHTELPEGKLDEVMELVAALEGDDDVQNVYTILG